MEIKGVSEEIRPVEREEVKEAKPVEREDVWQKK